MHSSTDLLKNSFYLTKFLSMFNVFSFTITFPTRPTTRMSKKTMFASTQIPSANDITLAQVHYNINHTTKEN
uniref:Putative ovule protein n=1 Tax=Solanum chacoense TaxID=4108 RepID=A0A0V0HSG3_SOLCH